MAQHPAASRGALSALGLDCFIRHFLAGVVHCNFFTVLQFQMLVLPWQKITD
jgi:hypothetical protein